MRYPAILFFFQAEDGIRDVAVTGVQTCALPIWFRAENAAFAEACGAAGLVFVGPPPSAIRAMGDKTAARRIAREMGVPMVPGPLEPVADDAAARAAARELGYPLMIKAAMGGGGK